MRITDGFPSSVEEEGEDTEEDRPACSATGDGRHGDALFGRAVIQKGSALSLGEINSCPYGAGRGKTDECGAGVWVATAAVTLLGSVTEALFGPAEMKTDAVASEEEYR